MFVSFVFISTIEMNVATVLFSISLMLCRDCYLLCFDSSFSPR